MPNKCVDVGVNRSHPLYQAALAAIYDVAVRKHWMSAPEDRQEPALSQHGTREYLADPNTGAAPTREERVCDYLYVTSSQHPDHNPGEHTNANPYNYRDPVAYAQWARLLTCNPPPTPLPKWVQGASRAIRIPQGTLTGPAPNGRIALIGNPFDPPLPRCDGDPQEAWSTPSWSDAPQFVPARRCEMGGTVGPEGCSGSGGGGGGGGIPSAVSPPGNLLPRANPPPPAVDTKTLLIVGAVALAAILLGR